MISAISVKLVGRRSTRTPGRPAFTLVELVTVMAILGVLVTLTVGAVQGIRDRVARQTTEAMFAALSSALQAYYEDWGRFPWPDGSGGTLFGQVSGGDPNYVPAGPGSEDARESVLFAALTMRQKRGPYYTAGPGQTTVVRRTGATDQYFLFIDGWGRKILYERPTNPAKMFPLLRSLGKDEFDNQDDMTNY